MALHGGSTWAAGLAHIPTCEHERLARTAATRGGTDYSWRRRKPLRFWTRTTPARSNELRTRSPLLSRVVGSGASWPQKALIRAQRRPVQRRQPPRVGHAYQMRYRSSTNQCRAPSCNPAPTPAEMVRLNARFCSVQFFGCDGPPRAVLFADLV